MEGFGPEQLFACLKRLAGDMSLRLNGELFELKRGDAIGEDDGEFVRALPGGLEVVTRCRFMEEYGAVEWVHLLKNVSNADSALISEVCDCDCRLPLPHEEKRASTAYMPREEDTLMLCAPAGSTWSAREFSDDPRAISGDKLSGMLFPGKKRRFEASGGRSSEARAPFFNFRKGDIGYIVAVGWSGQWFLEAEHTSDALRVSSGVCDLGFRLKPGESLRLSSVLIMPYEGRFIDGQNKWRRLVRAHYTPKGARLPFCAGIWGGMSTGGALKRLRVLNERALPFDCVWMDAGWYGIGAQPSPDEFEGDWALHTGDWRVNPNYHPDRLLDVTRAVHGGGRRFILWFEPERVRKDTPIAREHPEYFLSFEDRKDLLLNLGDPAAYEYCLEMLSAHIKTLKIDILRIDFNIAPLKYWTANDEPGRAGITQVKHIMGLYRLWDALISRFPGLLIDNCASGGRRIDIETLRRSVPLWRSDAMCPADFAPETAQCHALTFPLWLPYSGTGTGRVWNDTYRFRSCYAPALTTNYTFSERDAFGDDEDKLDWLRRAGEEYLCVKPYLDGDFYPLTELSTASDAWTALQYHLPEKNEGIILAFRREDSPFSEAVFAPEGLDRESMYVFTDADDGAEYTARGDEVPVTIAQKRASKLLFYRRA